jgi:sugar O-acyltransferase (sialic acid O-acetyltransferase NeuD family)
MKTETPIIILGASGHAKVVIGALRATGGDIKAALDDDEQKWGAKIQGVTIEGPLRNFNKYGFPGVIAIGHNITRRSIAVQFMDHGWSTVIHPIAWIDPSVRIGKGTVVFAGAIIQPDSFIGNHVILNTSSSIDHDCSIGDFVHIAPGVRLAGGVIIEEGAFLGIGSIVLPGARIGSWATVGAGSVVIHDVPPGRTVAGIPAKPLIK